MLYRPLDIAPLSPRPTIWSRVLGFLSTLRRERADFAHLDSLRPEELAELGLSRVEERDYRTWI